MRQWSQRPSWLLPVLVFIVICLGFAGLSFFTLSWQTWRGATCLAGGCFCEAIHHGTIDQPVNAWSSLAFSLTGLLILGDESPLRKGAHCQFNRQPGYRWIYSIALIIIGLVSAFYHASLTFVGQFFDVFGMVLFSSFILLFNLRRLRPSTNPSFIASYISINSITSFLLVAFPETRRWLFALLLISALSVESLLKIQHCSRGNTRLIIAAVGSMAVAFLIWNLDNIRILCDPNSLFQGHAIWHILGALSAWLLYRYYVSDTGAPRDNWSS